MNRDVQIITVEVRRSGSGLYTATSDALDGVYMAHHDREAIVADLPAVVRRWFKNNHDADVEVFMRQPVPHDGDGFSIPTIPVPVEIAARSLGR
jgi:hypothetical protein